MGVPIEEVRFFYADDDLVLDQTTGQATIRQRKDAFYVLEDDTWDRARFMSCMSAMHWANIDYLPVVELFKSLLPGTGSAAFELIRGLFQTIRTRILPGPCNTGVFQQLSVCGGIRAIQQFLYGNAPGRGKSFCRFHGSAPVARGGLVAESASVFIALRGSTASSDVPDGQTGNLACSR